MVSYKSEQATKEKVMRKFYQLISLVLLFNGVVFSQTPLYSIGNTVQVGSQTLNVRLSAAGTLVGTQPSSQTGIIINGPTIATYQGTSYVWYDVSWHTGVNGWSIQDGMALVTPPAPSLTSPGSNSSPGPTLTSTTLTFMWSSVSIATSYGLYIRDLNTGVLSQYIISAPTTYSTQTLTNGHPYRWNMQAFNGTASSLTTGDYYFQINAVLLPPTLASPINGQIVNVATSPGSVSLNWNSVSGAIGYQLNIDGSWVTINNGTQMTYSATLNAGSHQWQARTENSAGVYGSWSSYQSFSVQVTQVVMLVNPNSVLDFGSVTVGQSKTLGITFTNESQSTTSLVIGSNFPTAPFQIVNGQSLDLSPGSSTTLNFTFTPTSAGGASESWPFTDNATNWGSPWTITLQGNGVSSTTFGKGSRVIAGEVDLPVRSTPPQSSILFYQVEGVHGTIVGPPVYTDGSNPPYYTGNWWQIQWDSQPPYLSGQQGWSAESYIKLDPTSVDITEPNFQSQFYTIDNPLWHDGYAPISTNPTASYLGTALGNCTWYAEGRMLELGFNATEIGYLVGDAKDWAVEAQAISLPNAHVIVSSTATGTIPPGHPIVQKNAVPGSFSLGHVAVVESVNGDGTITVTESSSTDNTVSPWMFEWRRRTVLPTWFDNFIQLDKDQSLAVQVSTFTAVPSSGVVTLKWRTRSETNNRGFIILRKSLIDTTFKPISSYTINDSLSGLGTSSNGRVYTYIDAHVLFGTTYNYELEAISYDGVVAACGELGVLFNEPFDYSLYQNYPNPFNPSTTIRFDLKQASTVILDIYDILGRKVLEDNNGTMNAGRYEKSINLDAYSSGVFFYRIDAVGADGQRFVSVKQMLLIK